MTAKSFASGRAASPASPEDLLAAVKLSLRIDVDDFDDALTRNIQAAQALAERQATGAPASIVTEAIIRFVAWLHEGPTARASGDESGAWRRSGAEGLLSPWTVRRAGAIG